jgi:voltage-gated potassium channel
MTPDPSPFRKIYITFALLFLLLGIGVSGFMLIEQYRFLDALYMTVITLSTVGYGEIKPLSDAGKAFNIFLISTNLILFTYFISILTTYFFDGEFRNALKLRRMKNNISALRGHTIVCGYGRNGQAAAEVFRQNKMPFVVIERSLIHTHHLEHYLEGDATREELLIEAGIAHASALITALSDDAGNLYIVLSARQLNSQLKIISRASDDQAVKKMRIAGADNVIMPDKIGGTHMATLVTSPDVKEFIDMLGSQSFEGTTIQEVTISKVIRLNELNCWQQTGARVLGIKLAGNQYIMNPAPTTTVEENSRLIVMGNNDQIASLKKLV